MELPSAFDGGGIPPPGKNRLLGKRSVSSQHEGALLFFAAFIGNQKELQLHDTPRPREDGILLVDRSNSFGRMETRCSPILSPIAP
ncbi:hypothetical protein [uncultured Victivallis sp.]|uniref:hypothetical protein n=1 Tax=Victivallis sp. TaxID=2049020 RepID=UPI0025CEDD77|nr:hypothetical protein [uncultured Victivallis sp.]